MSSKRDRDRLQREIFDSLPPAQIFSAAGLMMQRQHTQLPDNAPIDLNRKAIIKFIESLDGRGLRELRRVAKGLERYTAH
jgi:hypothetical protein